VVNERVTEAVEAAYQNAEALKINNTKRRQSISFPILSFFLVFEDRTSFLSQCSAQEDIPFFTAK
jgi:hypothetical protein